MDQPVTPGEDFYLFINGDWISAHPVPPDKTAYDAFTELSDTTEDQLRSLIEEVVGSANSAAGSPSRMIGDLYRTGMDTDSIERLGQTPIQEELDRINALKEAPELPPLIAHLVMHGIDPGLGLSAEIDAKDSTRMIAGIEQGGLGLPNREYYLKEDPESREVRNRYLAHITSMLSLLGRPDARKEAETVLQMETRLAKASNSPEENRDPEVTYHRALPRRSIGMYSLPLSVTRKFGRSMCTSPGFSGNLAGCCQMPEWTTGSHSFAGNWSTLLLRFLIPGSSRKTLTFTGRC
jgi:putative endopeptidase